MAGMHFQAVPEQPEAWKSTVIVAIVQIKANTQIEGHFVAAGLGYVQPDMRMALTGAAVHAGWYQHYPHHQELGTS